MNIGKISDIDVSGLPSYSQSGLDFITSHLVPFLVSIGLFFLLVLSLVFLVIGGIMWITSGGNKEGLAKAKATVTYALIGLVLGLGSFVILRILGNFFGINLIGRCVRGVACILTGS